MNESNRELGYAVEGEGFLDTYMEVGEIVVGYQSKQPLRNTGRIFIAQLNKITPDSIDRVRVNLRGQGYHFGHSFTLEEELKSHVTEQVNKPKSLGFDRKPGESFFAYFENERNNLPESTLMFQIAPQDVGKTYFRLFGDHLTIDRHEVVLDKFNDAMEDYRKLKERNEDFIKGKTEGELDIVEDDFGFYVTLMSQIVKLSNQIIITPTSNISDSLKMVKVKPVRSHYRRTG